MRYGYVIWSFSTLLRYCVNLDVNPWKLTLLYIRVFQSKLTIIINLRTLLKILRDFIKVERVHSMHSEGYKMSSLVLFN